MNNKNSALINLTNHPSKMWSDGQLLAAKEYVTIIDLPFPAVDETADELYIKDLAHKNLSKILEYRSTYDIVVHIMGEMTFTFAIIKMLQEEGVKCIASTTKRIVLGEKPGIKEEVVFEFCRFREYV